MANTYDPHQFVDPDLVSGPNAAYNDPDDDIEVDSDEPGTTPAPQEIVEPRPSNGAPREAPSFLGELGTSAKAFGTGVAQGVRRTGEMVGRAGIKAAGQLGIERPEIAQKAVSMMDRDMLASQAEQDRQNQQQYPGFQTPLKTGQFVGEVAPYAAIPGGATGGLLRRVTTGAIGGAAGGYVNDNTLLGTILGGGVPGVLGMLKGLKGKLFPGKTKAAQEITSEVARTGAQQTDETLAAAKRVGVSVTPAEATGSPILETMEKGARVSKAKQAEISSNITARSDILNKKTRQLAEDMVPEGDEVAAATANKLYKEVDATPVETSILERLKQNPIIKRALSVIRKDPTYRADLQKTGTVGELRAANDYISDQIQGAAKKAKANLVDTRVKLTEELDAIAPAYREARSIQQRIILKDKTLTQLDKVTRLAGKTEYTLDQAARTLWGTAKKQNDFLGAIKVSGGNVQQAKDIMRLVSATSKSPLASLVGKKPAGMPLTGPRELSAVIINSIAKVRSGFYNKGLVNLMMDPKWSQEAARAAANNSPAAFAALVTKASIGGLPANQGVAPKAGEPVVDPSTAAVETPKDHIREAIVDGITKSPELRSELKQLPQETQSTIEELLQMDEKDYYEKYLDTPAKRQAYLQSVADAGGNTTQAAKLLRTLNETDQDVKDAKNPPEVDKNIQIGRIILMFISALVGGVRGLTGFLEGMAPFLAQEAKAGKDREADIKKLIKKRRSTVSGLLTTEIGLRTQQ